MDINPLDIVIHIINIVVLFVILRPWAGGGAVERAAPGALSRHPL